jgi:hypothetical protein
MYFPALIFTANFDSQACVHYISVARQKQNHFDFGFWILDFGFAHAKTNGISNF